MVIKKDDFRTDKEKKDNFIYPLASYSSYPESADTFDAWLEYYCVNHSWDMIFLKLHLTEKHDVNTLF